jgi:hypothetical protein
MPSSCILGAQLCQWPCWTAEIELTGCCLCAGDTYGRRLTLLISVLLITLPTLLIGCLPTYAQIGLAAPILMAFLRFVQGIAVGGEVRLGACTGCKSACRFRL